MKGVDGLGKCTHASGLLFAVEDFTRRGLKSHPTPLSCTSRLSVWNVPRNDKVEPQPISKITIRKIRFGKPTRNPTCARYDPRAEQHRQLDPEQFATLQDKLKTAIPDSMFHLFHDDMDTNPPMVADEPAPIPSQTFSDTYDISSPRFREIVAHKLEEMKSLTEDERKKVEEKTRGQSVNKEWKEERRQKLTASNFGSAITCRVEPSNKVKAIMYSSFKTTATEFGNTHEEKAVKKYLATKRVTDPQAACREVGLLLSRERPWLGASLDRLVEDSSGEGGLEVKCPVSKQGMTVNDTVRDKTFCLGRVGGNVTLKASHKYYHQVQGQLYCSGLPWVEFVVYLGESQDLFVQRVYADKQWQSENLPKLDYFYSMAILPELMTERVKRGKTLYEKGGWKPA